MTHMATDISSKASGHWDKLENIFEERVAKALNKLGVPSAKDVNALIARIDALNQSVQELSAGKPGGGPRHARPQEGTRGRCRAGRHRPGQEDPRPQDPGQSAGQSRRRSGQTAAPAKKRSAAAKTAADLICASAKARCVKAAPRRRMRHLRIRHPDIAARATPTPECLAGAHRGAAYTVSP